MAGTLGRGGAERQLINMLRALQNEGINSRVLCLTKGEALEREILDLGINVDWVGPPGNNFVRLKRIIGNFRRTPVDVIQSAHFYTNLYAALAGRALRVANIGAIRNDLKSEIAANGFYGGWQLTLPVKLIANSQLAVDRAIDRGVSRDALEFVRNVVAEREPRPVLNSDSRINILFAGRLVPQKRPELFLELASQLLRDIPTSNLNFQIAGDGPLRPKLEQLAVDLGLLPSDVTFWGEQPEMNYTYQNTDILVLTSEHEGTPNVVLEAMAHGISVVATRVGGVPEIVAEGCGMLVEPHDLDGLVDATRTLILDRGLRFRMAKQAREHVRKNHSFGYLQKRLTGIYSQVLTKYNANRKHGKTAQ